MIWHFDGQTIVFIYYPDLPTRPAATCLTTSICIVSSFASRPHPQLSSPIQLTCIFA